MTKKEIAPIQLVNYYLILVSVLLIIIGYILMTGTSNNQGGMFNDSIFSIRRITFAPVIMLCGYIMMFFAIMARSEKTKSKRHE